MKKIVKIAVFFLLVLILNPIYVFANITCNDGTISPSCSDCHQGCCSHHGGCLKNSNYSNVNNDYKNKEKEDSNGLLPVLGIGSAIAGGFYIGKKRSEN